MNTFQIQRNLKRKNIDAQIHRSTDPDCLDCDEPIYFAMHDKHHKFSLSLTTLIECLKFAENEGAIPPIDISWWGEISNRVPSIHVLKDNTIRS